MLSVSKDPEGWKNGGRFDDFVERYNINNEHAPLHPRSATVHVWMIEQYERDLAEWEGKARSHLLQCDASEFVPLQFERPHL